MSPQPIQYGGAAIDLSPRLFSSSAVVASPALAAETIVCSVTLDQDIAVMEGVVLFGFGAFTVGTAGVSVVLRIRATDVSGTVVASTGAVTYTAADLGSLFVHGIASPGAAAGQKYVLTAQVASGGAESTFSAVRLTAFVV